LSNINQSQNLKGKACVARSVLHINIAFSSARLLACNIHVSSLHYLLALTCKCNSKHVPLHDKKRSYRNILGPAKPLTAQACQVSAQAVLGSAGESWKRMWSSEFLVSS
jgi:hypothetical protein